MTALLVVAGLTTWAALATYIGVLVGRVVEQRDHQTPTDTRKDQQP